MEKTLPSMDCPTLLLIHQMVIYNINRYSNKKTTIESNLQRIATDLGKKIMMKVSNCHSSKTRGVTEILKLFANEYWSFIFGKKGEDVVSLSSNSITFKDKDFELITRVSGVDNSETRRFVGYLQIFCVALFEASLAFLDLTADVKMRRMENHMVLEVSCLSA